MQTWRLIDSGFNNGYYNMAVDEAIAIAVREGRVPTTLRFYTWNPPCISIGYFQKPDETLNGCIVRRITGGRAVFHGSDLSYSVVSATDNTMFPKNINGTYSTIAKALTAGLRHLGINPDPVEEKKPKKDSTTDYHKTRLCFNTAIRHEITVHGKKLIGSAQRRWSDVFLQHGSILVRGSMTENGPASISLKELGAFSDEAPLSRRLTKDDKNPACHPVCHPELISGSQAMEGQEILKQVQNDRVDGSGGNVRAAAFSSEVNLLVASLSHGFSEALGIQFMTEDLSGYELELSDKLIIEKYSRL